MSNHEALEEMREYREQIEGAIEMAESLLRSDFPDLHDRAYGYWLAHIKAALGGHGYSSMHSMEDTINEMNDLTQTKGEDPYKQGYEAYYKGDKPSANPYGNRPESDNYESWDAGWEDARHENH